MILYWILSLQIVIVEVYLLAMEFEYDSKPFTLNIGDFSGDNKLNMALGNCGQYSFTEATKMSH